MSSGEMDDILKSVRHEASCLDLDARDCLAGLARSDGYVEHLNEAIRRHAVIGRHLSRALAASDRRQQVLSRAWPRSLPKPE